MLILEDITILGHCINHLLLQYYHKLSSLKQHTFIIPQFLLGGNPCPSVFFVRLCKTTIKVSIRAGFLFGLNWEWICFQAHLFVGRIQFLAHYETKGFSFLLAFGL